jgi:hypothetical protein
MTWNKLDAKQKTWIFLGTVGALALWLLWPAGAPQQGRMPVRPPVRQAPMARPQPSLNRAAVPVLGAPANTAVSPAPNRPAGQEGPFGDLLGQYAGREMLSNERGTCVLRLELRRGGKPGEFAGFTRLVCTPTLAEVAAQNKKLRPQQLIDARNKAANPTLATLAGSAVDGSIRLHAVRNFGVRDARTGCEMTALSVTPGGTEMIDVDWQESPEPSGLCRGAQMQMKRFAR